MSFLFKDWVIIPLVGICTFIICLIYAERVLNFLKAKSLGKKDEILKYMRLMGSEIEEAQLTKMLYLISFGLGAVFFLIFWPNLILGVIFGSAVTVAGWSLPLLFIKNMYEKRCTAFVDQMVDGLTIMANGIKAGSNPQESMRRVTEIMPNPMRAEFTQVLYQMQVGDSFESALNDLGTRIPRPDVQMFVTSINILKETGGNLAETFQTIVLTVRERQKIEKKIEAMTAQGVMQGIIITCIPFILGIVFYIVDPNFIKPMFTTTLGLVLVMFMLAMILIGGILIKKVVTIKV